ALGGSLRVGRRFLDALEGLLDTTFLGLSLLAAAQLLRLLGDLLLALLLLRRRLLILTGAAVRLGGGLRLLPGKAFGPGRLRFATLHLVGQALQGLGCF